MPENKRRISSHILGGRLRTSTVTLIAAFIAVLWLQQTYEPEPEPEPAQQVVPPGYIPNPDYTWVPRTDVRTSPPPTTPAPTTTTTTPRPTTTTTTPSPTTTTTTTSPTTTTPSPREAPATTVIDPDGPGPAPPTTVVETDPASPFAPGQQAPTTTTTRGLLPGLP